MPMIAAFGGKNACKAGKIDRAESYGQNNRPAYSQEINITKQAFQCIARRIKVKYLKSYQRYNQYCTDDCFARHRPPEREYGRLITN